MLLLRSLIFNIFLYVGIVTVFLIALPTLFLPPKFTLLFGKFLGHYVVFIVKIFLNILYLFLFSLNMNGSFLSCAMPRAPCNSVIR